MAGHQEISDDPKQEAPDAASVTAKPKPRIVKDDDLRGQAGTGPEDKASGREEMDLVPFQ